MPEVTIIDPMDPPAWWVAPSFHHCRRTPRAVVGDPGPRGGSVVPDSPDPAPDRPPAFAAPTRDRAAAPRVARAVRGGAAPAGDRPRIVPPAPAAQRAPGESTRACLLVEILPDQSARLRAVGDLGEAPQGRIPALEATRLGLRTGDLLDADLRADPGGQASHVSTLHALNGEPRRSGKGRPPFAALTPVSPSRPIRLETTGAVLATRVLDLFIPVGFGQRGILLAPPRAGKTTLLKQIGAGIAANHPMAQLILLLIGERPEEITELSEALPTARVFAISYDDAGDRHVALANLAMEHAKRLAEQGRDAVVLLDSATRLVEAHHDSGGAILSGGVNAEALAQARQLFGIARATREGGTITTLATVLRMPANRGSDVVGEQLKSTSNLEIHLSADLAERRIWPAIDIVASGTRNEAALIGEVGLAVSDLVRRGIKGVPPFAQAERYGQLLAAMKQHPDNVAYMREVRRQAG